MTIQIHFHRSVHFRQIVLSYRYFSGIMNVLLYIRQARITFGKLELAFIATLRILQNSWKTKIEI